MTLPRNRLLDHMPDRSRAAIPDILARNRFFQSAMASQHTTLTVGNTQTQMTTELQRIRAVQVGPVSGGTLTIQVQEEGRDIFADASRPVSGGTAMEPTAIYIIPAGTVINTIVEVSAGAPTGAANVVIETEPYQLLPRAEMVTLRGKDRLLGHKRRDAELENLGIETEGDPPALASVKNRPSSEGGTTQQPGTGGTTIRKTWQLPINQPPPRPKPRGPQ